jgi:hypothetical protein
VLTHVQHLHPFNYLIADAQGELAVVEAHPTQVRVIEPTGSIIAATNHYRHPDMRTLQQGRKLDHSVERLNFLYSHNAGAVNEGAASVTDLLMHHTSRLCGHAGGHTTLWSLSANLTAHTIAYAFGPPCQTAYERVDWPTNS